MAKNTTIRKFKKDDYSSDFNYGIDTDRKKNKKDDPKKKHREASDKKRGFDHLRSED